MAWTYLDTVTATTGQTTVQVDGQTPLNDVLQGWALLHENKIYELADGLDESELGSTLYLVKPWPAATVTAPMIVVPVNNSYESLLRKFQQEVDSIEETRDIFDLLTWREPNEWLQVTEDGTKIKTVDTLTMATTVFGALGVDPQAAADSYVQQIKDEALVERTAAETITADRAVSLNDSGEIVLTDPADPILYQCIGLALNTAAIGEPVVVRLRGKHPITGLTIGARVWVGANGTLVQAMPTSGYVMQIGMATDSEILLNIQRPFYRNVA